MTHILNKYFFFSQAVHTIKPQSLQSSAEIKIKISLSMSFTVLCVLIYSSYFRYGGGVKNGYQVWTFSLDSQVTYTYSTDKCILNLDISNTDISNNMDMSK